MTATNTRHAPHCSCLALQNLFRRFASSEFFHSSYTQFPKFQYNFSLLHTLFLRHAYQVDTKAQKHTNSGHSSARSSASEDLWSINFTQISLDFEGTKSSKDKALNFICPFPLCVWACLPRRWEEAQSSMLQFPSASQIKVKPSASFSNHAKYQAISREEQFCQRSKTEQDLKSIYLTPEAKEVLEEGCCDVNGKESDEDVEVSADVHVLLYSSAHVKVRLNHYQYLMLLRMKEVLQTFQEQLTQDTQEIIGSTLDSMTACMGIMFNSTEVALLMHPTPGSALEPRSMDSDTTSLIESELSPSDSREGLAAEGREMNSDAPSDKENGSPTKVLEDSGIENTDTSINTLQDAMLKSRSDGSLVGEEFHSQTTGERGSVEEAHEAEEILDTERQSETTSLSQISQILPSSPSSIVDPLGSVQISLNGQEEVIPLKNMEMELSNALHITKDATKEALHVTMDLTKEAMSMTKDAFSLSKEKMASTVQKMLFHPQTKEPAPKDEEGSLTPAGGSSGRMRIFSMKRTASQHSFDTSSLDGSGPEDRLSVDSDGSDGFVMLMESDLSLFTLLFATHVDGQEEPNSESPAQYYFPSSGLEEKPLQAGYGLQAPLFSVIKTWLIFVLQDDSPRVYPTSPGPIPIILAMDHIVVCCNDDGVFLITAAQGETASAQKILRKDHKKQRIPVEQISAGTSDELQLKDVPTLERELQVTKKALAEANMDKVRLLQEIRKYDPLFQL
ncbi:hypothetical protein JD844_018292 [Phrynosoma platyrhinos]|uniref:Uncharacterized protein n=1 Tax=Phrynosoma platyrhinos TaxID=52577 RepID=A0ABQ7SN96_PHRPL|nr:hypothetical protein JD844_018292 [Phrynosoma platyrhinos]